MTYLPIVCLVGRVYPQENGTEKALRVISTHLPEEATAASYADLNYLLPGSNVYDWLLIVRLSLMMQWVIHTSCTHLTPRPARGNPNPNPCLDRNVSSSADRCRTALGTEIGAFAKGIIVPFLGTLLCMYHGVETVLGAAVLLVLVVGAAVDVAGATWCNRAERYL